MKLLKKLLLLALLIALLAGAGLYLSRNGLVALGIENAGESALGTPTSVDKVRTGLFSGDFAIAGLSIANPAGFSEAPLFQLGEAGLELPLMRALEDKIEIDRLAFSDLTVRVERNGNRFNFQPILDHLASRAGEPAPATESQGTGREILLRELAIDRWKLELDLGTDFAIPPLELDSWKIENLQLGGEGASPLEELIARITEELLMEVTQVAPAGLDPSQLATLANVQAALSGDLDTLLNQSMAEIQSQAENFVGELQGDLQEEVNSLTDGLQGELNKQLDGLLPGDEADGSQLLDGLNLEGTGLEALEPQLESAVDGLGKKAGAELEGASKDLQEALDKAAKDGTKGLGGILKGLGSGG